MAAASGPTVGGLLVAVNWRLIFLINLPIGVAAIASGLRVLPEVRAEKGTRLPDVASGVALLAAVTLLTLGLVQSAEWGCEGLATVLVLAAALVAGVIVVRLAFTRPDAVVEASLFRASREFSVASAGLFLGFLSFGTFLLITVLFFQDVWHYSALRTGVAIFPGPGMAAVLALNAGSITRRFGRSATAVAGALLFAAGGLFWLLRAPAHPEYILDFLPGLILTGTEAGLVQAPLFATAGTLPGGRSATGSAVLNMARQVGSAVGVAVLVTLLAGVSATSMTGQHRGRVFLITCSTTTALVVGLARSRSPRQPSGVVSPPPPMPRG